MKYVITCPSCTKQFRSSKERPLGNGVECPKCGEQFYVTAENQSEADKKEEAERGRDDDRDRRRDPRRRGDDEPSRIRDEHLEDRRPAIKSKGRKGLIITILAVVLALFMLAGLILTWYSFFQGTPGERMVRPPRDFRDELFAYVPSPADKVEVTDYDYVRQTGGDTKRLPLEYLPKDAGIPAEQVAVHSSSTETSNWMRVTLLQLVGPMDLKSIADRCKFQLQQGDLKDVYTGKEVLKGPLNSQVTEWAAFQPAPTKIVFVQFSRSVDQARLAALVKRDPSAAQLSPTMREGLALVSGYPKYGGSEIRADAELGQLAHFSGTFVASDRMEDQYRITFYRGGAEAKSAFDLKKEKSKPDREEPNGEWSLHFWWRGDRLYHLDRTRLQR